MADRSSGSISEIVNNIACELAKKKLNFKESDKDDQSKLALLSLEISKQQEEVRESIDGIYNTIKTQYFNMILPKGIKQEVAEYVFMQVNEKNLYSISEIEVGDATVKEILVSALQNSDKKMEFIEATSPSTKNSEGFRNISFENIKNKILINGKEYKPKSVPSLMQGLDMVHTVVTNSSNPNLDFRDDTDADAENIISIREDDFNEIYKNILGNPEHKKELIDKFRQGIEDTEDGLGVDAGFRMIQTIVNADNYQNLTEEIPVVEEMLKITFDNISKQKQDAYTTQDKMSLLIGLLSHQDKYPEYARMIEVFKTKEPSIYQDVSQNLKILQALAMKEFIAQNGEVHNGIYEVISVMKEKGIDTYDEDSIKNFIEVAVEYSKEQYVAEERNDNSEETVKYEETPVKQERVTSSDSMFRENVKKIISNPINGMRTVRAILRGKSDEDKKDYIQSAIIEKLLLSKDISEINTQSAKKIKKDFFESIITRAISAGGPLNQQLLDDLVTIDVDAVKKVLKEDLIPAQNDAPSTILGQYVQAIGETVKNVPKREILNPAKTSFSRILGNQGALVEKVNRKKDDEGPEL